MHICVVLKEQEKLCSASVLPCYHFLLKWLFFSTNSFKIGSKPSYASLVTLAKVFQEKKC